MEGRGRIKIKSLVTKMETNLTPSALHIVIAFFVNGISENGVS
jgi:hypothetical protein